jgi:uridine kinase
VTLFKYREQLYSSVYGLGDAVNYFYGYLVPSTGYVTQFDLTKYFCGFLLRIPEKNSPWQLNGFKRQDKLFKVFREHKRWANILGVSYVGQLNQATSQKRDADLIKISEALHEKKIARIADKIYKREKDVRVILIAGPSSSGKTTFSKRLSVHLMVLGLQPVQISLDNYFVDRDLTPLDEKGDYNFETIKALDIDLFNQNLQDLIAGKETYLPKFDFTTGKQTRKDSMMQMKENQILVIEGIHGLNPELTASIPAKAKYGIFVSALTQISIDAQNPIPSTDNRLIRRIVRDYRFRNYSALDTLARWDSVRKGEEHYIFPYQENADSMFNSALLYELAVLKTFAEPIIKAVPETRPEYAEAQRLLKFLSYLKQISARDIPPTSIIREFLGGSSFVY